MRAGEGGVLVEPGGVCREGAFGSAHLVNSPAHKLPKAHKEVWGKAGGVFVVGGGGGVSGPVFDQQVSRPGPQGVVGMCHELGWRDVAPRGEVGVEDEGEAC